MNISVSDIQNLIRETIRQELAAFFNLDQIDGSSWKQQRIKEVDGLTAARIRSAARSDLTDALARKQTKRGSRNAA